VRKCLFMFNIFRSRPSWLLIIYANIFFCGSVFNDVGTVVAVVSKDFVNIMLTKDCCAYH
jgi:hypothetical protein